MTDVSITIRAEASADHDAIERLHARAFGPGRYARTAFRLREMACPGSAFGFVAHVGTFLAGSVRLTPVRAGDVAAAMLGPLTVDPAFEGRGVGAGLMREAVAATRLRGCGLILLVGDLAYYARFGFGMVTSGQLVLPGPVNPARLLALELTGGALEKARGPVRA
jgi:predicted N-acetyltransferase YhbS